MSGSVPASSGVFISYRRPDSDYPAGWLFDRLAEHFGRAQVFKAVGFRADRVAGQPGANHKWLLPDSEQEFI